VARAYHDQLSRSGALAPQQITALNAAIAKVEASPSNRKDSAQLKAMGTTLDKDAAKAKAIGGRGPHARIGGNNLGRNKQRGFASRSAPLPCSSEPRSPRFRLWSPASRGASRIGACRDRRPADPVLPSQPDVPPAARWAAKRMRAESSISLRWPVAYLCHEASFTVRKIEGETLNRSRVPVIVKPLPAAAFSRTQERCAARARSATRRKERRDTSRPSGFHPAGRQTARRCAATLRWPHR
jgi:hypothetical protein